jgi:hypothetical protein
VANKGDKESQNLGCPEAASLSCNDAHNRLGTILLGKDGLAGLKKILFVSTTEHLSAKKGPFLRGIMGENRRFDEPVN